MKKKLMVLSLMAIVTASIASGTLAYFTAESHAHNVITTGNIKIEIVEKTLENGVEVDFPASGLGSIMPGTSVSKIVSVKNTGEEDAWIRVAVTKQMRASDGNALPMELTVKDTVNGGNKTVSLLSFEVDPDKWVEEDGYYYHKEPVAPGAFTEILFDEVYFAKEIDNTYQGCTSDIFVSAHAVQVANNPIPEGEGNDVTDVKGWPKTEGGV